MAKLLLLDGNSLLHRAFHALPPLTNTQGEPTNAVYGFTNMLWRLLEEEQPDYLAVAFDIGKPTLRQAQFVEYKANRPPTAPELKGQFALVKNVLQAMDIAILEKEDYEADDILGTLATKGAEQGYQVVIITGDRDLLQLVNEKVIVKICKQGIAKLECYDQEKIEEKYNLQPRQIIDLKGLMGDTSDNIPGVPGIGEKTALKLLHEYKDVEEVLANIPNIKGKKIQENLAQYREKALLSKNLATICINVPLEYKWENLIKKQFDEEKIKKIFVKLDFTSLLKKIKPRQLNLIEEKIIPPLAEKDLAAWLQKIKENKCVALKLDITTDNLMQAEVKGIYFSTGDATIYLGFNLFSQVQELLEDVSLSKYVHDLKSQLIILKRLGLKPAGFVFDTMLAAYLLSPSQNQYLLEDLADKYLPQPADNRISNIYYLQKVLLQEMKKIELVQLYYEVELPLVDVLAEMEMTGVSLNQEYLSYLSKQMGEKLQELEEKIYTLAEEKFNINSPKQLGIILFEKLQLPVGKKTKTGYSTNADVLEFLRDKHEIVEYILHYRQLGKLKSTYVDALPKLLNEKTGRLHTCLNQTVTATGRLSSSEPNLQNIPIKSQLGKEIRKAFIANKDGNWLLAADYSQIELRILAHITEDEGLCSAFRSQQDIHTKTAAEVFDVEIEQVNSSMRSKAKAVNFGIVYGISDFGLAQNLQVSPKEAKKYIDSYFVKYPGVRRYMEETIKRAKEQGYVTTILNRRRYLPDLKSSNYNVRSFAERTAINTPIQGSAADIIKIAMLKVASKLKEKKLKAKLVLQVHDELILEVPEEELEEVTTVVREAMEKAVSLSITLDVDIQIGKTWCDLKE